MVIDNFLPLPRDRCFRCVITYAAFKIDQPNNMFNISSELGNIIVKIIAVDSNSGDAVAHMIEKIDTSDWKQTEVQYIALDIDASSLRCSRASTTLLLSNHHGQGLGLVGDSAALAERERIRELLTGTDMVFIVANLGSGTGSSAAPVVAKLAHELGIPITVGVVTLPNAIEGELSMRRAHLAIDTLAAEVDSLIALPADKLGFSQKASYKCQNDMMLDAVRHIIEMFAIQDLVGVDFADVSTTLGKTGVASLGVGYATNEDRAQKATMQALAHPLLKDIDLSATSGALVKITSGIDFSFDEFEIVSKVLRKHTINRTIVIGCKIVTEMQGMNVTILVAGTTLAKINI